MHIKVTVNELLNVYGALQSLALQKLPARAAYWVSRLLVKLDGEYRAAEGKRVELIKKHGGPDKDSGGFRVPDDKMPAFLEEWNPIAQGEIEIETQAMKIEVFDGAHIEPAVFAALDKLMTE